MNHMGVGMNEPLGLEEWRARYGDDAVELAGRMMAPVLVEEDDVVRLMAVAAFCGMVRALGIVRGCAEASEIGEGVTGKHADRDREGAGAAV